MVLGAWGKKLGMSQRFVGDKVVPVTAILINNWFVTNLRMQERDGYSAIQIGQVKKRYSGLEFSSDWIKSSKKYFTVIREIRVASDVTSLKIGDPFSVGKGSSLITGDFVNVSGITKGAGFQGVVKRHGFTGGTASHGSNMGKRPGSSGFFRARGKVIKGKRFPGHMGVVKQTMQNLEIVAWQDEVLLVKGSIPGKARSLVYVEKI